MDQQNPSSNVHSSGPFDVEWSSDPLNYAVKGFVAFLQTIFEEAPPGYFHWSPTLKETEIVITEENPVKIDTMERRPAISVILGPVQFNGTSLDELVNIDFTNAKETHTDLVPGTMSLNCLSKVPQEARFIAWLSCRTIWNLRKLFIREHIFHEVGRRMSISSVTPAGALVVGDTEGEWHSCMVSCPFFMQWTDSVTPLAEDWNGRPIYPLRHIQSRIQTRLAQGNLTHEQNTGRMCWGTEAQKIRSNRMNFKPARLRGRIIRTGK